MSDTTSEAPASMKLRARDEVPDRYKWDLTRIYPDWATWKAAYDELSTKVDAFAALRRVPARWRCAELQCEALERALTYAADARASR